MLLIKWQHIFQKAQIKQNSVGYIAAIVMFYPKQNELKL